MSELTSVAPQSGAMPARSLSATERLQAKYFRPEAHPYRLYEREIKRYINGETVLLDAGCGRSAEVLHRLGPLVRTAVGADVVDFAKQQNACSVLKNDICRLAFRDNSFNIVICRSVLEHIERPPDLYQEFNRVLKLGGRFIFLTPNLFDYGSLCSKVLPNKWHPFIVRVTEGRAEEDTFPVHYKSNTAGAIRQLAKASGFVVEHVTYLGQYPSYLMFNPAAFLIGTAYEKVISRFEVLAPLRGWVLATLRKDCEC